MSAATVSYQPLATVLLVGDESVIPYSLQGSGDHSTYRFETATRADIALERLHHEPTPDLVLIGSSIASDDGLRTLQLARQIRPDLRVIMVGNDGDTQKAVQAMRLGALDYLRQPIRSSELEAMLQHYLLGAPDLVGEEHGSEIMRISDDLSFVCASPAMKRIYAQAQVIAKFDIPVLMLGESGTGKEVISELIHSLSRRSAEPFLKVNCAAVPADLLESELFGYEAGAFTGAAKAKPGKFEQCEKGTILLDEIGEMSPPLQAKLLHFLQDQTYCRLGSRSTTKADVRILAATNIDIEQSLASKSLREDLYYRLNGFTIHIPPLRERRREIPLLLEHFMEKNTKKFQVPPRPLSQRLLQEALAYSWPGNLRQLETFVRRYLVLGDEALAIAELQRGQKTRDEMRLRELGKPDTSGLKSLARSVKKEAEAEAIAVALEQTHWHRQKAAALLKISYKALLYKIKQYDLHPPESD